MATYTARIMAIDCGTTSTRSIIFDVDARGGLAVASMAQEEFAQHYPQSGWVEHDPWDLWATAAATARAAIEKLGVHGTKISAIGLANQRETTLLWDRATGQPLHPAIVWQDRRTASMCDTLRDAGHEALFTNRTGLLLDAYFSATKLKWLLDTIPDARARAIKGELAFGTVDSWLIWNLTGDAVHATDATNAARTMLFDISKGCWDADICALLDIPMQLLPEVRDSADDFGETRPDLFGTPIPIRGVAGDQQSAMIGQACFQPGMVKSTYGTGCFAMLNTGGDLVRSGHRMLGTIAYRLNGKVSYALEGSIFNAGAIVQWLRDGLQLVRHASETKALAELADPSQQVVLVPAFTGLGAPYWRPNCRGALLGMTRNTGPAEIARAALESVGYQTRDLLDAMRADWADQHQTAPSQTTLRVDGGMSANDWAMQFLADILGAEVDRPKITETTALGAAYLAGLHIGVCPPPETFAHQWSLERRFVSDMSDECRDARYAHWRRAVDATIKMGGD